MKNTISPITQAILLLTSPLVIGKSAQKLPLVTPARYRRLAHLLNAADLNPSDFLGDRKREAIKACKSDTKGEVLSEGDADRILARGFQLSQALDYWASRSIWVASRVDSHYPQKLKKQFRDNAPGLIYGSGEPALLDSGGLAVVGSRKSDRLVLNATADIGQLAAQANVNIISGCAKGVDQISMLSALGAGGTAIGVLGDSLIKKSLDKDYRTALLEKRLVLISTQDPSSRFETWKAMDRNKYIYGLSDVGLVMKTDYGSGGTWTGAVEQLDKLKLVPIYVRLSKRKTKGSTALLEKGAIEWPNPCDLKSFRQIFEKQNLDRAMSSASEHAFDVSGEQLHMRLS
tara:strand:- start:2584 stop:3618 length:1035 start_codon:yes stop_codon:yes gene_type:complete